MTEFWILSATHVGMFVFGVVVAKNLTRWFREKFLSNPAAAISDEIAQLKARLDKIRGQT